MNINEDMMKFLYILLIGVLIVQPVFGVISLYESGNNQTNNNQTVNPDNQTDNQTNNNQTNNNQTNNSIEDICMSKYPMLCTHIKPPIDIELPLIDMYQISLPIGLVTPD